jgi:hydroxyacylglutathione hydrolase
MKIEQFEDKALSHYSYAILNEQDHKIVLIDPARNIAPYMAFAKEQHAAITAIIETHPHADFVSGHLELHQLTGATIYCSKLVGALYPHCAFDDGESINLGDINFKAINTPGHSPDSICVLLQHNLGDVAVFTGDTLFIGDCGRPDLRENTGNLTLKRQELAALMFHSLRDKLMPLNDDVLVYPSHGAGTLCGKALSEANRSTLRAEKMSNWCLQPMTEAQFTTTLLADQPFVPKYFAYNVELNKKGAPDLFMAFSIVSQGKPLSFDEELLIIDTRPEADFKQGHIAGSVNLQAGGKFETWLGSIVAPYENFYLVAANGDLLIRDIYSCAKIGYEPFIKNAFVFEVGSEKMEALDLDQFKNNPGDYTILDIRNPGEVNEQPVFANAIAIPLPELRERVAELPLNKPIVVHCAGGYRSAGGSSLLQRSVGQHVKVYDLGEAIKQFL